MIPHEFDAGLLRRYWAKVDRRGPDECWEWTGSRTPHGYGRINMGGKYGPIAHANRLGWQIANGVKLEPCDRWKVVRHTCDNPPCCNPAHLVLGTQRDNAWDRERRGRGNQPRDLGNGRAKFAPSVVREVIRLRAAGVSGPRIARRFSMSTTHVYSLERGTRRPHLHAAAECAGDYDPNHAAPWWREVDGL